MIHETTEGIEFESSDMESKEPDYEAAYNEMMTCFHRIGAGAITGNEALSEMRACRHKHTLKPETLADVVLRFCEAAGNRYWGSMEEKMFYNKMRDLVKKEEAK